MNLRCTSEARRGQALVEFTVALVAITAILAGLLTIGRLGREHLNALHEARSEAASRAMAQVYITELPYPRFLRDWDAGPDRARHSRDDAPRYGDASAVVLQIAAKAKPEELGARVSPNPLTALATQEPMIYEYRLVSGRARPRTVPLLPVARHLLYNADAVTIEADAWLTWTQGIQ